MTDILHDQLQMQGIDPLVGRRFLVRKRDGRVEEFNEARILLAIEGAFRAHLGVAQNRPLPETAQLAVKTSADKVVERVLSRAVRGEELEVELIQDAAENQLMLDGHLEVARRYILYREMRRRARAEREGRSILADATKEAESKIPLHTDPEVSTRLLSIYQQALPKRRAGERREDALRRHFDCYLNEGDYLRCLTPALLDFDSELLGRGLRWERDAQMVPAALETLYEDFLARENERRIETPQYFWMRVAMGLALPERIAPEANALRFYEVLSTCRFVPSEAILRHAGTPHPALTTGAKAAAYDADRFDVWHRGLMDLLEEPSRESIKELWIPDLFLRRVVQEGQWTLFDPAEAADLERGPQCGFEARYLEYEQKAGRGEMAFSKQCNAAELWRAIMDSVRNIGAPVIVFKDGARACNTARPVGAVNLAAHVAGPGLGLDVALLRETITAAVRMLDNAIDLSVDTAMLEQRPIGLGLIGIDEAMERLQISGDTQAAADFIDRSAELVSHCAIMASAELARERGSYPAYADWSWPVGISTASCVQDWEPVRAMVRSHGVRNGDIMTDHALDTPTKIAGLASAHGKRTVDPLHLIDCAARRQKWMDTDLTLTLPVTNNADPGSFYIQAWEKGIRRIKPLLIPAEAEEVGAPESPDAVAAATV